MMPRVIEEIGLVVVRWLDTNEPKVAAYVLKNF
jgi:hypothetical protein